MSKAFAIARRELKGYFDSPVAYIVIVTFLLVTGWLFFSTLFLIGRADLRMLFTPTPFSPALLLVILAPAITMRLVAEERKAGTIELLTTMPVRTGEVVIGKFLAALALAASALAATVIYALSVSTIGPLDWGPVLSGYLGLGLFTATLLAIGLMCSTWTNNQIVAFIIAFLLSAGLYYIYWLQMLLPPQLGALAEFVSLSAHLDNMARGVIDSRDVLYYLSLTGGALFVAQRALARQSA